MSRLWPLLTTLLLALHLLVSCGAVVVCVESDGTRNVEWALCCGTKAPTPPAGEGDDAPCGDCTDHLAAAPAADTRTSPVLAAVPVAVLDPATRSLCLAARLQPLPAAAALAPSLPREQRPFVLRS